MTFTNYIALKQHLNIDPDDDADNSLLQSKIEAAEQWVGKYIGTPVGDLPDGQAAPVQEAVNLLVGHLYENREASLVGVSAEMLPFGIYELLAPYREYVF